MPTTMSRTTTTATLAMTSLLALTPAWADDTNPLVAERWQTRPLVIVAPTADDPLLRRVESTLKETAPREAFIEREMVLYRVVDGVGSRNGEALPPAQTKAMLSALDVPSDGPATLLLVGKDGGTKVREQGEVDLSGIFATIDRMPMRQSSR